MFELLALFVKIKMLLKCFCFLIEIFFLDGLRVVFGFFEVFKKNLNNKRKKNKFLIKILFIS